MPVLSRVIQATSRSIRAIRRVDPRATVIVCDHVENYKSRNADLQEEVARRNARRFLGMDLLLGTVDRVHPLFGWLTRYGMSELDLDWFGTHPQTPDILGIDYYPNSEWQLHQSPHGVQQRRSESPVGLYGIAATYYQRYGIPMMVTETSADGHAINREIWLEKTVEDCRRLREQGILMHGYFWWPMVDQLDWDGALTHHIGKIHDVGLYNLKRDASGDLTRHASRLVEQYKAIIKGGDHAVGVLEEIVLPGDDGDVDDDFLPAARNGKPPAAAVALPESKHSQPTNGHASPDTAAAAELPGPASLSGDGRTESAAVSIDRCGILVFSHLRWGFVWQRPQQFLSRFAKQHQVLFVEEPVFDADANSQPRLEYHQVMPNVTVLCPHLSPDWRSNPNLPECLRRLTREGVASLNDNHEFDLPLLWYYSPMDAAWSLGHFPNRGVIYDCMDELSNFTGAPPALVKNELHLINHADIVFAGGYALGEKKSKQHPNVHTFGCGVDFPHFSKASDPGTAIPPDIDFMKRPILGWFGVVDERVNYDLVGDIARRRRPDWSIAMVGPVVKVDPNLLPHSPNLFWLGSRDYQQLPNYCRAFDVCMMCFAINTATDFINPTKGLEYMATGKPIVSTPVRDVVRQWSDIVRIAGTTDEFIAATEEALKAGPDDPRIRMGRELAQKNSWESTVQSMDSLIRQAVKVQHRRSANIQPLSDGDLAVTYRPTPGS
jgi:glycosyltransferase involved in cell wall biosynthesis